MIKLVIANTHSEARRYCYEHQLDGRTMTITPACGHRLRGISISDPSEVVNIVHHHPDDMSDAQFEQYLHLMDDLDAAKRRGGCW